MNVQEPAYSADPAHTVFVQEGGRRLILRMNEITAASKPILDAPTGSAPRRDDVVVRLMHPEETDEVAELSVAAYSASYAIGDGYRADIAAVADRAREHEVWVAADAATGALLGTVATPRAGRTMSPVARDGELDFRLLAVAPDARRRGIGETLVEHVLGLARERGSERVVLNTGPEMLGAHRLYERLGFERLPEREHTITRPDGSSFLLMAYGRTL